jgi:hypothetical protein
MKYNSVFLSRCLYILNMAEAFYILNIEWTWKLNHNKDSRHVSPITDSQNVQAQVCTDMLGHETNSKLCLRNTALLVVCRTVL